MRALGEAQRTALQRRAPGVRRLRQALPGGRPIAGPTIQALVDRDPLATTKADHRKLSHAI
jgi:hypothetical protein